VDKSSLEGWSPARFRENTRAKANVEVVSALALDDDASMLPTAKLTEIWADVAGLIHTTHSHADTAPKHRLVFRVSRDMTPDEHARVWRHVRDLAASRGQKIDEATKDASRFWYVPGHAPNAPYAWCELAGAPLDVDAILATTPIEPEPTATAPAPGAVSPDPSRRERVKASMERALEEHEGTLRRLAESDRRRPVAAMLGAAWPAKGRHEAQLALAGALRAEGWSAEETVEFLCDVCRAAGDENRTKREATVRHTWSRPEGSPLTGWTRLKAHVDPVVVDAARGALGRDAEWTERTTRRLAELAAALPPAEPHAPVPVSVDGTATIDAGPFRFHVGGLDAPIPPLTWQIDGIICKSDVVMLVAHGNSLKTWLAFSLALSVATGRPWLDRFASIRGRAGLIDFESGDPEVRRRLKLLGAQDTQIDGRLLRCSYPGAQLTDPDTWIALAELQLELIVVDSFSASSPSTDENDARAALVLQLAGRFANATGCTVIFIHHARKGSGGDRREVVRGSTALFAACDRVFEFADLEKLDGGIVRSTMRSVKDGSGKAPGDVRVELSDSGLKFVDVVKEPSEEASTPERNRKLVLEVLKQHTAGITKADLINIMKGKRESKYELLSSMLIAGITVEFEDRAVKKTIVMLNPTGDEER